MTINLRCGQYDHLTTCSPSHLKMTTILIIMLRIDSGIGKNFQNVCISFFCSNCVPCSTNYVLLVKCLFFFLRWVITSLIRTVSLRTRQSTRCAFFDPTPGDTREFLDFIRADPFKAFRREVSILISRHCHSRRRSSSNGRGP